MWFSLFSVILILTITFFQGLQGLFSGLIMCVLTLLSAALAFGFYEDVYYWQLVQPLPAEGRAVALVAIFVLSLLVLRVIFDQVVKGNMHFPVIADRIGGGVLGFVSALIIVGVLTTGIQMLPFGTSFLGFSRYALVDATEKELEPTGNEKDQRLFRANLNWSEVERRRRSLWLSPDGFTVGLVSSLSQNALRGRNALPDVYPDFLGHVHNARSRYFAECKTVTPPDAISVVGYWDMPANSLYTRQLIKAETNGQKLYELKPDREPLPPGTKRVVVRLRLSSDAQEEDSVYRFTTQQVRLVGRDGPDGPVKEFFVTGISHDQVDRWVRLYAGEGVARQSTEGALTVDLIYEVPDSPDFEPLFIEFKQNARVEIRLPDEKTAKQPIEPVPPSVPKDQKKGQGGRSQGSTDQAGKPLQDRISGIGPARKESVFKNDLPFNLTSYTGNAEVVNGEVRGGRIVTKLDADWQPVIDDQLPASQNRPPASRFQVPDDKRMLQLSVEKLQPQSWLGNIYGGIIDNIRDFYLIDEGGANYMPVGHYAIATVNGEPTFELMYLDESQREFGRLPKFEKIKARDLKGDYALFFLFNVPPGCKPVKVHTGRTDVDLRGLNLVAPQ